MAPVTSSARRTPPDGSAGGGAIAEPRVAIELRRQRLLELGGALARTFRDGSRYRFLVEAAGQDGAMIGIEIGIATGFVQGGQKSGQPACAWGAKHQQDLGYATKTGIDVGVHHLDSPYDKNTQAGMMPTVTWYRVAAGPPRSWHRPPRRRPGCSRLYPARCGPGRGRETALVGNPVAWLRRRRHRRYNRTDE